MAKLTAMPEAMNMVYGELLDKIGTRNLDLLEFIEREGPLSLEDLLAHEEDPERYREWNFDKGVHDLLAHRLLKLTPG